MSDILFENRDWRVTERGLELKEFGFSIDPDALRKYDWFTLLSEKVWFDPMTFSEAYYEACRLVGPGELTRDRKAALPNMKEHYDALTQRASADATDPDRVKQRLTSPVPPAPTVIVMVNEADAKEYQEKSDPAGG